MVVVALLCVAQFVVVLDATIVAIALPAIQADFGLSTTVLGWVITAYTLTFGGCLLAAGRLADRVGRRRAFTAGLVLFMVASLACGWAPSGGALVAARAVQGLGAALVAPAALALLTTARPDGRARARALGWWTAAAAGGGASGWVLGGLLSGLLDWRWVFFVNVPICAAAVALGLRVLPERREASPERLDIPGALLATAGLGALVLALTLAQSRGVAGTDTLIALGAAATLLWAFTRVEARAADPLLGRAVLRRPRVLEPNLVAVVLTAATTPPMFLCTLYAQQVLGLGPVAAGLLFPPFNLAVVAGSLAGPRIAAALGERRAMAGGLLGVTAGALALFAVAPGASPLPSLLGGFVLMGTGLGVASVASTARGTAALPGADQGLASGLLTTSAQVGTVLGLAVVIPIAAARTAALGGGAAGEVAGYELGFALCAALAAGAALAVATLRRRGGRLRRAVGRRGTRVAAQEPPADDRADGEDARRPPEGGRVPLDRGLAQDGGRRSVIGHEAGRGGGGERAQQRGPYRAPICWEVLIIAEATPLSRGGTPKVAVANDGPTISPNPTPIRTSDGRTCDAYAVSTPMRVSSTMPRAALTMPAGTSGRGPVRGRTRVLTIPTVGAIEKLSGRNASPVSSAVMPLVSCR
jgi:EmrB/QacA subfamily drug resistance transporter